MISVCMAVYNGEKYIKKQIDSILQQLDKDDELIISDDNSTDSTLDIIRSYLDNRIILLNHKMDVQILENRPQIYNRKVIAYNFENALKHAKGDYIFLSDQDDIWLKNRVDIMCNHLQTNDLVMCNYNIIDEDDKIIKYNYYKKSPISKYLFLNIINLPFRGCCMAFNHILLSYVIPFPSDVVSHDSWIGCIANKYGKIGYLSQALLAYRIHRDNSSMPFQKSLNSVFFKMKYRLAIVKNIFERLGKDMANNVCYGCGVCVIACKHSAIILEMSVDGYWIPKINRTICTHCGSCNKICSFLYESVLEKNNWIEPQPYSFVTGNKDTLPHVSSGGAGYEIGRYFLNKKYKIVGAIYDYQKNRAAHTVVSSEERLRDTMGSKYLQSYTVDAFKKIDNKEKYVIFGCPCQIDSFRRYARLNGLERNYFFVDFFCHGFPSYHLWKKYMNFHIMPDERLAEVKFRDKRNGWNEYTMTMTMTMTSGREYSKTLIKNDYFLNIFLGNYVLNEPCYTCKFHGTNSAADIRMGDLWGRKYRDCKAGISGVIAFTNDGIEVIKQLQSSNIICKESIENIIGDQIVRNIKIPKKRKKILKNLSSDKNLPLFYVLVCYKRWIKNAIPKSIKNKIKDILRQFKE